MVEAEMAKKEDRRASVLNVNFKEYVSRYRDENLYMISAIPPHLKKDVPLAYPLQVCFIEIGGNEF